MGQERSHKGYHRNKRDHIEVTKGTRVTDSQEKERMEDRGGEKPEMRSK